MRSKVAIAGALAALWLLSGCQHDDPRGAPYMGGPDNFGEANRVTMAAQVIDPTPEYASAVPESQAEHAAQAVERYRTDKVKKPDRVKTTNAGADSSGGGSGGGN